MRIAKVPLTSAPAPQVVTPEVIREPVQQEKHVAQPVATHHEVQQRPVETKPQAQHEQHEQSHEQPQHNVSAHGGDPRDSH